MANGRARKNGVGNLSTAGCAQGPVDCCGYVENWRDRVVPRPSEHQVTSAATQVGTDLPKSGWLNQGRVLRIVRSGWPKVPEQPYLVRGSAGTGCKGNLGHPPVYGPSDPYGLAALALVSLAALALVLGS